MRTDTERLDWMEKQSGSGLISDDDVHWAVSGSGFQNVPINPPGDIETTFFVAKEEWRNRMKVRVKTTDGIELSTICRQLKMKAPDGKMCEVQLTQRRIDGR